MASSAGLPRLEFDALALWHKFYFCTKVAQMLSRLSIVSFINWRQSRVFIRSLGLINNLGFAYVLWI